MPKSTGKVSGTPERGDRMGSILSGNHRADRRPAVERTFGLDVRRLHRRGDLTPGAEGHVWEMILDPHCSDGETRATTDSLWVSFRWHWRRFPGSVGILIEQEIRLDWTPCAYGGRRPWWICPGEKDAPCGRRAAVLYPGGRSLLCRKCCGLVYETQRVCYGLRCLRKAKTIRIRLRAALTSWRDPIPPKPPGMHWKTYERLAGEVADLERCGLVWLKMGAWRTLGQMDGRLAEISRRLFPEK